MPDLISPIIRLCVRALLKDVGYLLAFEAFFQAVSFIIPPFCDI
jgi:hypothetical protein